LSMRRPNRVNGLCRPAKLRGTRAGHDLSDCRDLLLEVARHRARRSSSGRSAPASECPECHGWLERETALSAGLRALANAEVGGCPDVEARLMAAFATQRPRSRSERRGACRSALAPAGGRGRVVLGRRGMMARRTAPVVRLPTGYPGRAILPLAVARPAAGVESSPAPSGPVLPGADRDPLGGRRGRRALPVQAVGFVPMPSAAGLPDFESGEIVRMGIEVTALPNYGLGSIRRPGSNSGGLSRRAGRAGPRDPPRERGAEGPGLGSETNGEERIRRCDTL
jgi:hypothetical protein